MLTDIFQEEWPGVRTHAIRQVCKYVFGELVSVCLQGPFIPDVGLVSSIYGLAIFDMQEFIVALPLKP
jgi:hypothetical protein